MLINRVPQVNTARWYSIRLASRKLGVSRRTLYRFMEKGHLRFRHDGQMKHREIAGHEILRFWEYKYLSIVC